MASFFTAVYTTAIQPALPSVPLVFTSAGSVVSMFFLVYVSKLGHAALSLILCRSYDNVQSSHRYGDAAASKAAGRLTWQQKTVQRAFNAHNNQWEAFIGFSVAMILVMLAKKEEELEVVQLANGFLVLRIVYNVAYIVAFNEPLSMVRSAVWTLGIAILARLFAIAVPVLHHHHA